MHFMTIVVVGACIVYVALTGLRWLKRVLKMKQFSLFGSSQGEVKAYVEELKQVAAEYGLKHFPVISDDPLMSCKMCDTLNLVLMHPHEICGDCWIARLNATIQRDRKRAMEQRGEAVV